MNAVRFMAFVVAFAAVVAEATACPLCESETGKQVRAGIFVDDFAVNAATVLLPFPVLIGLVALIHFGFPKPKTSREPPPAPPEPPTSSPPRDD